MFLTPRQGRGKAGSLQTTGWLPRADTFLPVLQTRCATSPAWWGRSCLPPPLARLSFSHHGPAGIKTKSQIPPGCGQTEAAPLSRAGACKEWISQLVSQPGTCGRPASKQDSGNWVQAGRCSGWIACGFPFCHQTPVPAHMLQREHYLLTAERKAGACCGLENWCRGGSGAGGVWEQRMLRGMEDEEFWPRLPAPSVCMSPWVYGVRSHILVPSTAGEPGAGQASQGDLLQHRRGLKIAASSSRGAKNTPLCHYI